MEVDVFFLTVEGEGGGWRLMFFSFPFIGNVEGGGERG